MATYTGTGSSGSYKITSEKGTKFIEGAKAGETLTGGDGSKWTKNANGSTTIVEKSGKTYTVPGASTGSSGGGSSGKSSGSSGKSSGSSGSSGALGLGTGATFQGSGGGISPQVAQNLTRYDSSPNASGKVYSVTSEAGLNFLKNATPGQTLIGGDGSHWVVDANGNVNITDKNGLVFHMGQTNTAAMSGGGRNLPTVTPQATQQSGKIETSYAQLLPQQGGAGAGTYSGTMKATTPDGKSIDVSYQNGQRITEIPNGTIVHTQGGDFIWNAALGKSVPMDESDTVAGTEGTTMYTDANGNRVEGVYDDPSRYELNEYDKIFLTEQEQRLAVQAKKDWWAAYAKGDEAGMERANTELDKARRAHGYTLGADGATFQFVDAALPESYVPETLQAPVIENPWEEFVEQEIPSYREQQEAAARQQLELAVQQAEADYGAQKETVNQSYDDVARQLYIQRRMNEKNLPQQLAAMGYNGGLTESSVLGLQTSYQDSLRQAEQERITTINALDSAITQAKLSGNVELVNQLQTIAANVMNLYTSALGNIQSINTAQAQLNYNAASDNAANRYQAYNYALAKRQLDEERLRYDAESQQTAKNQLFSSGDRKLQLGIMPSMAELAAMDMTEQDARDYINRMLTLEDLDKKLTQAQTYNYYT